MSFAVNQSSAKRSQAGSRRLRYLIGALLACGAALPVTRLLRQPAPPPPVSAGVSAERQHWHHRLQKDVGDVEAHIRLGTLEDKAGFYTTAVNHLRAARALGAPDSVICGPLGRSLTRLARDNEALPELEKAAKLAPNSVEAAVNLAGLYINQDEPQTQMAAAVLKRFVDANQPLQNAAEATRLSLAFLGCDDTSSARKMAERAVELAPNDLVARGVAARGALAAKDFDAAKRHLQVMLAQMPDDTAALYLYGMVLEAQGDDNGALKQWQKAVARNSDALDVYEKIGNVYARRGDLRRAAVAYETIALREQSKETALRVASALSHVKNQTPVEKAKVAYWNAIVAGFAGDFPAALRFAQAAAANPATQQQGLQAMAEAYRGMQRKQPYIAVMRKITAGGSVDDLLAMAQAWGEADDHLERTEYLRRALAKAPDERQAFIHGELAEAYIKRGMRDEAERELEQAVQKQPRDPRLHRRLAEIYFERRTLGNRLRQAISEWQSAVALDPNQEADWQQLGRSYMTMGETARAVRHLEHAIDLEPGYGPAYLELGRIYARLGDKNSSKYMLGLYTKFVAYDQQRQTLRTRARREHASADDLIAYGDFLRKTGYDSDAVAQYEMAASLRPKDERLRAKLANLYSRLQMTDKRAQAEGQQTTQTGGS